MVFAGVKQRSSTRKSLHVGGYCLGISETPETMHAVLLNGHGGPDTYPLADLSTDQVDFLSKQYPGKLVVVPPNI